MKKFCLFIAILINHSLFAQDIILTVSGEYNNQKLPLDSILLENRTKQTSLILRDLPDYETYQVNLTKGALGGTTGIDVMENQNSVSVLKNLPGELELGYLSKKQEEIRIAIFNVNGQKVNETVKQVIFGNNSLNVSVGKQGIFLVQLQTSLFNQSFKTAGKPSSGDYSVSLGSAGNQKLKSGTLESDFGFSVGDSIWVSVFKQGFTSEKQKIKVSANRELIIQLDSTKIKSGTFVDERDGHVYKWVQIGEQIWMAENLAYLPAVYVPTVGSYSKPYYYVYGYKGSDVSAAKQQSNYINYGVLYNWIAAKAVCPQCWHLPNDDEWYVLEYYLIDNGFSLDVGAKQEIAKSMASATKWEASKVFNAIGDDLSLNNRSGFSALPGGFCITENIFGEAGIGKTGRWWSSTEESKSEARGRHLNYNDGILRSWLLYGDFEKDLGASVRCIKDDSTPIEEGKHVLKTQISNANLVADYKNVLLNKDIFPEGEIQDENFDFVRNTILTYNSDGRLVRKDVKITNGFNQSVSTSNILEEGKYTVVACTDIVEYENDSVTFQFWEIQNEDHLDSLKLKDLGFYGLQYKILGIAKTEIDLNSNQTVTLNTENAGALVTFYFKNIAHEQIKSIIFKTSVQNKFLSVNDNLVDTLLSDNYFTYKTKSEYTGAYEMFYFLPMEKQTLTFTTYENADFTEQILVISIDFKIEQGKNLLIETDVQTGDYKITETKSAEKSQLINDYIKPERINISANIPVIKDANK